MAHFLSIALSFPSVFYTVLLGVALVYWVFVMVGALHVNLLGDGIADAAVDAAVDGAIDGAIDGAAKGALEGATKGILDGAADHHGGELEVGDGHGAGGLMAALRLRSAPATVVLSAVLLFSWIVTVLGAEAIDAFLPAGALATAAKLGVLVIAPLLALLPSSIVVRPLARVFAPPAVTTKKELVGKLCRIRTGTVTDRFGEAVLEDGGAGLVVRVRVESGEKLGRGDQAVILGYDAERQEFTVAPLDYDDEEEPREPSGASRKRQV